MSDISGLIQTAADVAKAAEAMGGNAAMTDAAKALLQAALSQMAPAQEDEGDD